MSFQNILPDDYCHDINLRRNYVDKVFNTQCLIDLWITSQLRVLNGRFVGDLCGKYTCHKSYVQVLSIMFWPMWTLLICSHFFHFSNPTYLSDHPQISVHINCKINEHYSPNSIINNFINYSYKWESISKDKWLNTLSEPDTLNEIISFGNEQFEKNKEGINNATTQLTKIFENLAQKIL